MLAATIDQTDDRIGFRWLDAQRRPISLAQAIALPDAEPQRWLPTHLEALDDVLIDMSGRFAEPLAGGSELSEQHAAGLRDGHRALDRLTHEYVEALTVVGGPIEVRAGQIIGTAALLSIRARDALRAIGPSPLAASLSNSPEGMVSGHAKLRWADPQSPWLGARWVVESIQGELFPATLSLLLFDSSGVQKQAAEDEHREALRATIDAAPDAPADPISVSGAIDWLLFDWLMAHREGPQSAAIEIPSSRAADADLIVSAAAVSAGVRARFDPELLVVPI